jgi:dihydrofolate reductase
MSTIVAELTMSLDGFIAAPDDSVGPLFDWYENGPVPMTMPGDGRVFSVTEASAEHLRQGLGRGGAIVTGRRLFDLTRGWGGKHPVGAHVFCVTHRDPPPDWPADDTSTTFVRDGLESAVAQAKARAGDKLVGVAGPNVIQQCLNAGLLDEVIVNLVPVLLGTGIRFFENIEDAPVFLENPSVIEGDRVTHLRYRVRSNA